MKSGTNRFILAVDDDPAIRKVVGIILEKEGFHVELKSGGKEALACLDESREPPDTILLDIRMPEMSGLELLGKLKERYPSVPVIMLTASTDLDTGIETMRKGAFDYLVKPVRKLELVETIRKALHYRDVLLDNERLARENREYQRSLEVKVEERTRELFEAYEKLKKTNLDTVKVLAETIEAKDPYTRGHCNRVRILSRKLALCSGAVELDVEILEYGALLHDIGKIGISEALLFKDDALTPDEKHIFQQHTAIGENILSTIEFFQPCLSIVRHHHEWFDGSGYPDKRQGSSLDRFIRIVSITDSFDAMTSNRPYRRAMSLKAALAELDRGKGTQFDPELADLFKEEKVYREVLS